MKKKFFCPMGWFSPKSWNFFFRLTTLKKKMAYILVNGLMANFEFQDFRTKFWNFLCHNFHSFWTANSIFWYFSLLMHGRNWAKLEGNRGWHSMGWYYTVAQILGWAPTAVRVGWGPKYLGKVTYPHVCLMGPSYIKIPDLVSESVFTTWKMCLLMDSYGS